MDMTPAETVPDAEVPNSLVWQSASGCKFDSEDDILNSIPADKSHIARDLRWLLKQCNAPLKHNNEGYHTVRLENRIVQARIPAHNCQARPTVITGHLSNSVTGNPGNSKEYAIFSLFAQYYLDFKAIVKTDDKIALQLWGGYPIRWRDTWTPSDCPDTEYLYEGVDRGVLVIDTFTAYICGFSHETCMLTDSYNMEYNAESGLPTAISFRVNTGDLTDEQYASYRKNMRIHATNGFTAALASFERGQEILQENKDRTEESFMKNLFDDLRTAQQKMGMQLKQEYAKMVAEKKKMSGVESVEITEIQCDKEDASMECDEPRIVEITEIECGKEDTSMECDEPRIVKMTEIECGKEDIPMECDVPQNVKIGGGSMTLDVD